MSTRKQAREQASHVPSTWLCHTRLQVLDYAAAGGSPDLEDAPRVTDYPEKVGPVGATLRATSFRAQQYSPDTLFHLLHTMHLVEPPFFGDLHPAGTAAQGL